MSNYEIDRPNGKIRVNASTWGEGKFDLYIEGHQLDMLNLLSAGQLIATREAIRCLKAFQWGLFGGYRNLVLSLYNDDTGEWRDWPEFWIPDAPGTYNDITVMTEVIPAGPWRTRMRNNPDLQSGGIGAQFNYFGDPDPRKGRIVWACPAYSLGVLPPMKPEEVENAYIDVTFTEAQLLENYESWIGASEEGHTATTTIIDNPTIPVAFWKVKWAADGGTESLQCLASLEMSGLTNCVINGVQCIAGTVNITSIVKYIMSNPDLRSDGSEILLIIGSMDQYGSEASGILHSWTQSYHCVYPAMYDFAIRWRFLEFGGFSLGPCYIEINHEELEKNVPEMGMGNFPPLV